MGHPLPAVEIDVNGADPIAFGQFGYVGVRIGAYGQGISTVCVELQPEKVTFGAARHRGHAGVLRHSVGGQVKTAAAPLVSVGAPCGEPVAKFRLGAWFASTREEQDQGKPPHEGGG